MFKLPSKYEISLTTMLVALLLIVGLLSLNIALIYQSRKVKAAVYNGEMSLSLGKKMLPISGIDYEGQKRIFAWEQDNRRTLLLVFSPKCGACIENIPNWKAILHQIDESKFRVIIISSFSDKAKEFVDRYELGNFPTIIEPNPKIFVEYLLHLTPQTILISPSGEIEKVWLGSIQDDQKESVEKSLSINLAD